MLLYLAIYWYTKFLKTNIHKLIIQTPCEKKETRLIEESSAIGGYRDSLDKPGSSYLWVGEDHHLNRKEVSGLIKRLQFWVDNKRLKAK